MPDPTLIVAAMTAAAFTAAAVLLLCAWPLRTSHPELTSAGSALSVSLGLVVGCWVLGLRPHWPPQQDQDRLLFILLPILTGVEVATAFARSSRWLRLLLRLVVVAGAAPVLLYNSTYLADLAGPGTREWTPTQAWLILGGLAAALAAVWSALALLTQRITGRSVPLAVAVASAGAAITVMLSGYASGGQIGLLLAAALAGVVGASLLLRQRFREEGALGVGIVGLFALLVMGRFFGQLTTSNAALLFFALLLCWLPELPRGLARVVLVAVPVAVALTLAQQKFVEDSGRPSSGSQEPSIQDYLNFGK